MIFSWQLDRYKIASEQSRREETVTFYSLRHQGSECGKNPDITTPLPWGPVHQTRQGTGRGGWQHWSPIRRMGTFIVCREKGSTCKFAQNEQQRWPLALPGVVVQNSQMSQPKHLSSHPSVSLGPITSMCCIAGKTTTKESTWLLNEFMLYRQRTWKGWWINTSHRC